MVAVVEADTADVVTVKLALALPAATVTVVGTDTAEELSLRETEIPPLGADPVNVTVPSEVVPPVTEVGLRLTELRTRGVNVRFAVFVMPP
jgi:hypothetical protein